jgi:glycogen operon protein
VDRIDVYPTRDYLGYRLRIGRPFPFGASSVPGGVNFSIFSSHATSCILVLFQIGQPRPLVEIPFPDAFRVGNVFAMIVFDLDYEHIEYGYRMTGPFQPEAGHRFNPQAILLDPYARALTGREVWGQGDQADHFPPHRARLAYDDFDWGEDRPPDIPVEDLVVYEMHVRGFTRHPSSRVKYPGTFAGIRQKIPYLKELGVNCVELMPVFEFDEFEVPWTNPLTGERLLNYWGYSPLGFFAPKAGYAATGKLGMQVDELKSLVKVLHQSGIEVILDVVFNHTAEGGEGGPTLSLRGIDNKTYYMLTADGAYLNFAGTGNTLNCNHPVVRNLLVECLHYWAAEYHIDGFRFDLASVLGRDPSGAPLSNPPLLESLAFDPILARCKLIAEAWDAGGLYQVGSFPGYGRWAEWNGKYRDCLRRFLKGDAGQVREVAQRLSGSADLYGARAATTSVNFITCHDGFTLLDLVSYNAKHNEANGEDNRDGANDNLSWNCGCEGPTDSPAVNALRRRQIKNAAALLFLTAGIPMFPMGDEFGRSQGGNNNAYCHDSEFNWLNWDLATTNADLLRFFKLCIAFRKAHPLLRDWSQATGNAPDGYPAGVTWHGTRAWDADWSDKARTLAFMLCGPEVSGTGGAMTYLYAALNMHWETHGFGPPALPAGWRWHIFANTAMPAGEDIWDLGAEPPLSDLENVLVGGRSLVILVGKPPPGATGLEDDPDELRVPAGLESLPVIGRFVLRAAKAAGLGTRASYGLRLAVHEIAANSLTHGQTGRPGEGWLELRSAIQGDVLTITLEDTGFAYDPRQTPAPPDLSLPLEERNSGGLGVYLVLRSVDEFTYERVGNKNCHVFRMNRRAAATA